MRFDTRISTAKDITTGKHSAVWSNDVPDHVAHCQDADLERLLPAFARFRLR